MNEAKPRGRRSRRRGTEPVAPKGFNQRPITQLTSAYPPVGLVSEDQLEAIHPGSLKVLAQTGLQVLHPDARRIMREVGADVNESSGMVRFNPDLILEQIATVPGGITLHARNPAHTVILGDNNIVFNMMASAPNCSDIDRGRRTGTLEDYNNFLN